MNLDSNEINKRLEEKLTNWAKEKKGFKLSIRWNDKIQAYECFKEYFNSHKEEVLFHSKELEEILKRTCALSNAFAEKLANEPNNNED